MKTPKPEKVKKYRCPYCKGDLEMFPEVGGVVSGSVSHFKWRLGCSNDKCVTNIAVDFKASLENKVAEALDPKVALREKERRADNERRTQEIEKKTGKKRNT